MYPCLNPRLCGVAQHRSAAACRGPQGSSPVVKGLSNPSFASSSESLISPPSSQDDGSVRTGWHPAMGNSNRERNLNIDNYPTSYGDDCYAPIGALANRVLTEDELGDRDLYDLTIDDETSLSVKFKNYEDETREASVETKRNRLYITITDPANDDKVTFDGDGIDIDDLEDMEEWFESLNGDELSALDED